MLLHAHLTLVAEGDTLRLQHPALFARATEGEALGKGAIFEYHPMAGDVIRLQPRRGIRTKGVAHVAG